MINLNELCGSTPQQIADHLQEHPHHIDEYMQEIRRGKALALIVESATVTDTAGNPVDLANLQGDGTFAVPGEVVDGVASDEPDAASDEPDVASDEPDAVGGEAEGGFEDAVPVSADADAAPKATS